VLIRSVICSSNTSQSHRGCQDFELQQCKNEKTVDAVAKSEKIVDAVALVLLQTRIAPTVQLIVVLLQTAVVCMMCSLQACC
jgi:hypothetical protein